MTTIPYDRPRRRSGAPSCISPFWVFITRGGRPRNASPRLPALSDHLLRDSGLLSGKPDIAPARHAFQERSFR